MTEKEVDKTEEIKEKAPGDGKRTNIWESPATTVEKRVSGCCNRFQTIDIGGEKRK